MADGVNRAILIGNLGKDPEVSYTQGGTALCKFPLATGETFTNNSGERQEKTEWHNIIVWGRQGENVAKFLSKGRQVFIEGKIQTRNWEDEKSGQRRYMTEIVAQRVMFLGKGEGGGSGRSGPGQGGYGQEQEPSGYDSGAGGADNSSGPSFGPDDDDIPF